MEIKSKVRKLMGIHQPEQRTKEWFEMRKDKITASSAASLLIKDEKTCGGYVKTYNLPESFIDGKCANPYSSKKEYILSKCGHRSFTGSEATYWGTMLEQVATDIYCRRTGKKIIEFGLLPHPTIPFIGASPDGITPDGIMLEIKCPFRRKITGIPPFYYWIQVQLQLEVGNLKRCDFLECELVELKKEEYDKTTLHEGEEKGVFLEMRPKGKKDRADSKYKYPGTYIKDSEVWTTKQVEKQKNIDIQNSFYDIFPVYWKLVHYSVVRINRDKEWFSNILPVLADAWVEVKGYKENGCEELLKPKPELNIVTFDDIFCKKPTDAETEQKSYQILSDSDSD